jgi:hypothetical protein
VENDSATPKSRLSDRITESSSQPSTGALTYIFDSVLDVPGQTLARMVFRLIQP